MVAACVVLMEKVVTSPPVQVQSGRRTVLRVQRVETEVLLKSACEVLLKR